MAYKHAKEHFVAHGTGSSIAHIHAVSAVGWTSYILYASLVSRGVKGNPITDYLVVFLPLLLGQTICAAHPRAFNGGILALALLNRIIPHCRAPSLEDKPPPPATTTPRHRAFLTTWRAHMMCMTVIAILAVDFPLFPRSFGKTESYGTSLMDVGVGSFVFSQGLASSSTTRPSSIRRTITRCAPVIALGMIRVIMVKGVDYPEHVTEYGVHWNFFFTLAAMPILSTLLHPIRTRLPVSLLVLFLISAHTFGLSAGLEQWVMQPETTSRKARGIIYQNKEGLVSLPGYLAIYLIGNAIGRKIIPPVAENSRNGPPIGRTLVVYAITSWLALFILCHLGIPVSRRLTNAPYVAWTTAFNVTFLLGYYLIERYAFARDVPEQRKVPGLLQNLNKNGLVVFLVANLLTGGVNVVMESMYASDGLALGVLVGYTGLLAVVAWVLRGRRVVF